jgi:hypothetical protein
LTAILIATEIDGTLGLTTFEWLIGLLLAAVLMSALSRRLKVPYPTFLAIGGMLLAFVPSGPSWTLEPELALALFVAPVLVDAAYDTSVRDLRDNWLPVSTLVLIARPHYRGSGGARPLAAAGHAVGCRGRARRYRCAA